MFQPFSDEHEQFRKTVRAFAEKELAPNAEEWEESGCFPGSVFKRAGELGILGAHFPRSTGAAGRTTGSSVAKAEELPRSKSAGVGWACSCRATWRPRSSAISARRSRSTSFSSPRSPATRSRRSACREPAAGSDVAGIKTVARKDGDDYVINGQKTFITNGTRADFITLLAKTNPKPARTGAPSSSSRRRPKAFTVSKKLKKIGNKSSDTAELFLEACASPSATASAKRTWGSCTSCRTSRPSASSLCVGAVSGAST
jgi:citronellyl-CoA dehydrogenase